MGTVGRVRRGIWFGSKACAWHVLEILVKSPTLQKSGGGEGRSERSTYSRVPPLELTQASEFSIIAQLDPGILDLIDLYFPK